MLLRFLFFILAVSLWPLVTFAQGADTSPVTDVQLSTGEWTWIPIPEMRCRDGSSTGIGVRPSGQSSAVMLYLQGGGACYDAESCRQNAESPIAGSSFSVGEFQNWVSTLGNQGVFNISHADNPVAGWNHVLVPYCTGDLHGGNRSDAEVPGVDGKQQFVGYRNFQIVLNLLTSTVPNPADIALVGASAGGIGVLINYPQVANAFPGRSIAALVDSAPIIPESAIRTSCFQRKLTETFNLRSTVNCPQCFDLAGAGLVNLFSYLSLTYPNGRFALVSADADLAGVILYDEESKACGGGGVNIINYRLSLYALRDQHIGHSWSTFLPGGLQHTMTQSNQLFLNRKFRGVSAAQWLQTVGGGKLSHIPQARLQ